MERREAPPPHQRGRRPHQPPGGADRKAPPKRVSQTRWRLPALHCLHRQKGRERKRGKTRPRLKEQGRRSVGYVETADVLRNVMGLAIMILGLAVFLGVHVVPTLRDQR